MPKKEEKIEEVIPIKRKDPKSIMRIERIAYIAVIVILVGFITIDLSFFHQGGKSDVVEDQVITAAVVNSENKTNESAEVEKVIEEETSEKVVEEEKSFLI